ncbi:hypothetical protein HUB98_16825 [Paenibacillus barcinonensis]|uniref:Uncharacterized protein n=1 Tax=Paenibacillus barcinonensis TaxID=198119 RepID=A0ABX6Q7E3_PAEBA|nr:hypothetical protein [Paenibacillus barcinonensis]QKS57800.1 hypothetical protein HUB98_16825 [Paenibacillus barcinonensis]
MHGVAVTGASGVRLGSIRYEHQSKVQRERVERSFCICGERLWRERMLTSEWASYWQGMAGVGVSEESESGKRRAEARSSSS